MAHNVEKSSGCVFADLGAPRPSDAEIAKHKAPPAHDTEKLRELLERARGNRLKTLQLMPDKAQTWRIAKRLGIPPARAQLHAQWAKRNGLATWARSRWDLTPLGRALVSQAEEGRNA